MACWCFAFCYSTVLFDETARGCVVLMENMTTFFTEMLRAVAQFLGSDPIIYIFGLVCLCICVKVFKDIVN